MHKDLWLNRGNLCLGVGFYPTWPRGFRLYFHENGGRRRDECLDVSLQVWRLNFNVTIFGMKRLGDVLRFVPAGPRRRGFKVGWVGREASG